MDDAFHSNLMHNNQISYASTTGLNNITPQRNNNMGGFYTSCYEQQVNIFKKLLNLLKGSV